MNIYLIMPVRMADPNVTALAYAHMEALERRGDSVHYPPRDAPQDDPTGRDICETHRRALLTEIDRLRQDVLFEQERIAAFLEERDRLRGLLRSIACISHDGGLIRASQWEALVAIRRLTLAHWDKTGTREEHKGRCAAAFGEADATADQPPAVLDDCAAPPAKGDYVLATKYDDGDPGDQWSVGFYDRTDERGRHYVTDADGKQFRGNGFRRVERIGPGRGAWLLERAQLIASSDRSLWDWARDPMRPADNSSPTE